MTFLNPAVSSNSTVDALEQPIFLIGAERSGTTLLRLMLDGHAKIAWNHEFEYAVDQVSDSGEWPDLAEYRSWLSTHRIFLLNKFAIDEALDYPDLMRSFLRQKRDRHGKPTIGATVHRHFNRLLMLWPNAKLIYILRDGRDVARSNIGMGWAGNVWNGSERWIEAESEWHDLKPSLPSQQWIELRYEDLITTPEQELARLCDFMGLQYDPNMMSYIEHTSYSYPDPKRVQQWRKLSDRQIRLAESRMAPLLTRRGYDLSGLPPLQVGSPLKTYLWFQSWASRASYRMRQYGLKLFIAEYLTRKLGLTRQQQRIQHTINDRQNRRIAMFSGTGSDKARRSARRAELRSAGRVK